MRKNIQTFRENHGDIARVALFQLAALAANYFMLWPRRDANPVKTAINCVYSLLIQGAAYGAAKYLEAPKVQPTKDNKASAASEDQKPLESPAAR